MNIKSIFFAIILTLLQLWAHKVIRAQTPAGKGTAAIEGRIVDSASQAPVSFASIHLYAASSDSLAIANVMSDSLGRFQFSSLAAGRYRLQVLMTGYANAGRWLQVSSQQVTQAGSIVLSPATGNLQDITITAQKRLVKSIPGGYEYNAAASITAAGGTVIELLKNVPGVTVDDKGNIKLRGNAGITVMIDGKNTNLSGADLVNYLQQLNAADISVIKVNTNPTAQYDAAGSGGIIDIQLKKGKGAGLFGNASLGGGTHNKYNSSAALNYNTSRLSSFVNIGYRHQNYRNESFNNYDNLKAPDSLRYYRQRQRSAGQPVDFYNASTGMDYRINKQNTVGGTFKLGAYNGLFPSLTATDILNSAQQGQRSYALDQQFHTTGQNYTADVNYRHQFRKEGQQLTVSATYFERHRKEQTTTLNFVPAGQQKNTIDTNNVIGLHTQFHTTVKTFKADYVQPLAHNARLEAGIKYMGTTNNNHYNNSQYSTDAKVFLPNDSLSNQFLYHENISAAYVTYSGSIQKFSYQAGLRMEHTAVNFTTASKLQNEEHRQQYTNFFPNLYGKYSLEKAQEISLSISRRLNRPFYYSLNPFIDNSDPNNVNTGNPNLKPEYSYNVELGYNKYWGSAHSLMLSAGYNHYTNPFPQFAGAITWDSSKNRYLSMPVNYASANNYSFSVIAQNTLTKWLSLNSSFSAFYYKISDSRYVLPAGNGSIAANANVTAEFKFWKNAALQLSGFFNTPQTNGQIRINAVNYADLGFKKEFFNNKLGLNITISDIFNTNKIPYHFTSADTRILGKILPETRVASVKLTWKFGKKLNNKIEHLAPEENNRAGGK